MPRHRATILLRGITVHQFRRVKRAWHSLGRDIQTEASPALMVGEGATTALQHSRFPSGLLLSRAAECRHQQPQQHDGGRGDAADDQRVIRDTLAAAQRRGLVVYRVRQKQKQQSKTMLSALSLGVPLMHHRRTKVSTLHTACLGGYVATRLSMPPPPTPQSKRRQRRVPRKKLLALPAAPTGRRQPSAAARKPFGSIHTHPFGLTDLARRRKPKGNPPASSPPPAPNTLFFIQPHDHLSLPYL